GPARLDAPGRLWHLEGGPHAPDEADGGRVRRPRHPRQLRRPRPGRHGHGEGGPFARDPRRLSRRHPAQPLRAGGGDRGRDLLSLLGPRQLHHGPDPRRGWRFRGDRHRPADPPPHRGVSGTRARSRRALQLRRPADYKRGMPEGNAPPAFLTTKEVADLLRVRERKVYEMAAEGEIPCRRVTGKLLFPRVELEAWLAGGIAAPAEAPPDIVAGSHDPLLDWAIRESGSGLATFFDGSLDGLERVAGRRAVAAGMHVFEPEGPDWNRRHV